MRVVRKEKQVFVRFEGVGGFDLPFTFESPGEFYAVLMQDRINKEMSELFSSIRRSAYEAGWKDAKSKKIPKEDWFSGRASR